MGATFSKAADEVAEVFVILASLLFLGAVYSVDFTLEVIYGIATILARIPLFAAWFALLSPVALYLVVRILCTIIGNICKMACKTKNKPNDSDKGSVASKISSVQEKVAETRTKTGWGGLFKKFWKSKPSTTPQEQVNEKESCVETTSGKA
ncbi:hypothetical protein NM688_g8315 [Phlebia brevispora]|uniref:Uncharacterized protein n=1 Tax=Phlebia brevispora TaxID=194682 RepID=A0ACC1RTV6_9APHY|nr:hypothetical protein NM688_g8315 [Phlebia brevispora]